MKASELITLLQDAIDKYGDLPAISYDPEFGYRSNRYTIHANNGEDYSYNEKITETPTHIVLDPFD